MRTEIIAFVLSIASAAAQPGELAFTAPATWHSRPPSSAMRVAEFVVPHAPGDSEDAEAIIYFFGGSGGSADANITRWIAQMEQPDGKDTSRRENLTVNGLKLSLVDVSGTFIAEMRPGSTERHHKPGFRLRAAVVETPRGPYYIKMTGPAKTVAAADADFKALLVSLHLR